MKTLRILSLLLLTLPCLAGKSQQLTSPDQVPEGMQKSDWQSIRAAHEAWQHDIRPVDGGWQAPNPGQQWTTGFDGRGFLTTPKDADWTWGLELRSYGFGERQTEISGKSGVRADGQRIAYRWNDTVEEWFFNDARGLEHGFTISARPDAGDKPEPLVFALATVGKLHPSLSSDSQTIHFRDKAGAPVLNYSGLKVWDADGTVLSSRFQVKGNELRLLVEEVGARYPLTIDPIAQQAYLKASNTGNFDEFGDSVAVSGDTVIVGAQGEDSSTTGVNSTPNESASNSGAAYVFIRSGTTWSQQAYLKAANTGANDKFGTKVAVSGDTVVVGASWEDSSTTGVNSAPNESASNSGAAYVFIRSGTTWSQQAFLKASNTGANDEFSSVAVSGDTVVVGAYGEGSSTTGVNTTPNEGAPYSGAAYVFTRSGTTWSHQAYLKAANTGASDYFGINVAVSGDTVVVGARGEDSSTTGVNSTPNESASDSGAAYVFTRSGTAWSQQTYLKASNSEANDQFGNSVAVSGDTVVVGAYGEGSGTTGVNTTPNEGAFSSGAAYVFTRSGTVWSQQAYLKASNTGNFDSFGGSVAVSGDTVVVGARGEDSSTTGVNSTPNESASWSGAAYVFTRSGSTWSQQAYLKAGNSGAEDYFGGSVAVSGDTVVVGTAGEDSSTTGVNSTPGEGARDSGAAYIFSGLGQPDIALEAPTGTTVTNSSGTLAFGMNPSGQTQDITCTLRNTGGTELTGITPSILGTGASSFSLPTPLPATLAAGGSATFTVRFTATSGAKTATLSTASDDPDENPFTLTLTGTGNTAPTFSGYSASTPYQTATSVSQSKLLTAASDADGDILSVTVAGPTSAQGGTVALQSSSILYTPPNGFSGTDTFSVTIADPAGANVTGTVTVTVGADPNSGGQGTNTPVLTMLPGGDVGIAFQGIPGRSYQVQRSANLSSWTTIATVTAAANGAVNLTDEDPPPGSAFYRLRRP